MYSLTRIQRNINIIQTTVIFHPPPCEQRPVPTQVRLLGQKIIVIRTIRRKSPSSLRTRSPLLFRKVGRPHVKHVQNNKTMKSELSQKKKVRLVPIRLGLRVVKYLLSVDNRTKQRKQTPNSRHVSECRTEQQQ